MNEFLFFLENLGIIVCCRFALKKGCEALMVLNALFMWLANFFILKQFILFGINITASDMFAVGGLYTVNLIQNYYGKEAAKKSVYVTFGSLILYAICSYIHVIYTPSPSDFSQSAYSLICKTTPRLAFSSLIMFFLTQRLDLETFGFFRKLIPNKTVAIFFNMAVLQFIDTIGFTYLALWGVFPSLKQIIMFSYAIKMITCTALSLGDFWMVKPKESHV